MLIWPGKRGERMESRNDGTRGSRRDSGPAGVLVPLSAVGRPVAVAGPPPCHECTARCCRYFALEIDRPVTPEDHDKIRWYLLHENVAVWVQDGDWYLEIRNRCRSLRADNACGTYETRPQVCRDYGAEQSEDRCEYFTEELEFELHFETPEAFETWSRETLAKRDARLRRRRDAYRRRNDRSSEAIA